MKTTCPHCQRSVQVTQPQGVFACPQCGENFTLGQPAAPPISFDLDEKDMERRPRQQLPPSTVQRIVIVAVGVFAGLMMYEIVVQIFKFILEVLKVMATRGK